MEVNVLLPKVPLKSSREPISGEKCASGMRVRLFLDFIVRHGLLFTVKFTVLCKYRPSSCRVPAIPTHIRVNTHLGVSEPERFFVLFTCAINSFFSLGRL